MRYFIRSVKYFVYCVAFISLIIYIMVLTGYVSPDIKTMFTHGYDSVWRMALIVAAVAAFYPRIGYGKRTAYGNGNVDELKDMIVGIMDRHSYRLVAQEPGKLVFVKRSPILRLMKLFEDRTIISSSLGGVEIDGITKDVVRIKSAIEAAQQVIED